MYVQMHVVCSVFHPYPTYRYLYMYPPPPLGLNKILRLWKRRPLYVTATKQILNLSSLLKGSDIKRTSRRTVLLKDSDIKRTSRRTVLLKDSDIKRTSRRTVLLKGRNTRTIQLPLRHLKGISIGITPLSDWLNVLPRGSGIAWVTELPLPPKGMS